MPSVKLTARTVEAARPPASGRLELFDEDLPGFCIRVTPNGRRTAYVFHRVGSRLHRFSSGQRHARPDGQAGRVGVSTMRERFPPGWDKERVQKVLDHYGTLPEDAALAEDEAAFRPRGQTVMVVLSDLVPAIRALIANRR